jgi:hypothetical protein
MNDSAFVASQAIAVATKLAVEYRQRTHDWLCVLSPGEFSPKITLFNIKEG